MNFMKESNIKKGVGALMQPEILNKVSRDRGNFEFRANVEMNIYYNNNNICLAVLMLKESRERN